MLCYVMLCLCYVMLCYVRLCHVMYCMCVCCQASGITCYVMYCIVYVSSWNGHPLQYIFLLHVTFANGPLKDGIKTAAPTLSSVELHRSSC